MDHSNKKNVHNSLDIDINCLYGKDTHIYQESSREFSKFSKNTCVVQPVDLFPGVTLIFQDIHAEHLDFSETSFSFDKDILSIQHCSEGRFEGEYRNGECFYLGPGDLSVNLPVCQPDKNSFPLAHYHGLNLIIDPQTAKKYIESLEQLLGPLHIDFEPLFHSLRKGNHLVIYREHILNHLLSELYFLRTDDFNGTMKLKVLELLHHLCSLNTEAPVQPRYFNRSQVRIIKKIHSYLIEHPDHHDTLEELSLHFDIPLTSMKTCFKGVYGLSIGAYLREYRLQLAAEMLKRDTGSIGNIAFQVGYESPSKFTEAFQKKFHCSPSEYRKEQKPD